MRRLMGAVVVVIVLGGPQLLASLSERGPGREGAGPVSSRDSALAGPVSAPVGGQVLPARAVASRAAVPATFRTDPLGFLSTAPPDSLDLLPGVGPVLASRIVAARRERGPFTSWNDVLAVRGIGPATVEKWSRLSERR